MLSFIPGRPFRRAGALCAVAVAWLVAPVVSADVMIGNLPPDLSGSTLGTLITGSEARSKAIGFTTPSGDPYVLDSVTLVAQFSGDAATGGDPQVAIWSDVGGNPGAQLFVLDNPPNRGERDFYTWTAGSSFVLAPSTTYWVLVNGAPGNSAAYYWNGNSPNITPTGVGDFVGYRFSASATPPTGNSTVFNSVAVNATLVPEPASATLLLGAVGLMLRRRR